MTVFQDKAQRVRVQRSTHRSFNSRAVPFMLTALTFRLLPFSRYMLTAIQSLLIRLKGSVTQSTDIPGFQHQHLRPNTEPPRRTSAVRHLANQRRFRIQPLQWICRRLTRIVQFQQLVSSKITNNNYFKAPLADYQSNSCQSNILVSVLNFCIVFYPILPLPELNQVSLMVSRVSLRLNMAK